MRAGWLLLALLLFPLPARAQELQGELQAWVQALPPSFAPAHLGFQLIRLRDGQVLAEIDPQKAFTPASTMKVLTASRILSKAQPGQSLATTAVAGQDGEVVLVGGGDPELKRGDLEQLAQDLVSQGLRQVGQVKVDSQKLYVSHPWGPGWAWDDVVEDYSAEICPLTVDRGVLSVTLQALAGTGQPVRVDSPPELGPIEVRAFTGPSDIGFERWPGRAGTRLTGSLPEGPPHEVVLALAEPDLVAGRILRGALERRGVTVANPEIGRTAQEPEPAIQAIHRSRSVQEMLREALARSDNLAMELLLRAVAGQEAATDLAPRVVDASGLSRYNLVRPLDLVRVLRDSPQLRDMLPLAGQEGTMAHRLPGRRVRAKTGSMSNVSTLAGTLLYDDPGQACVFALMINGYPGPLKDCKQAEDALVERLLERL